MTQAFDQNLHKSDTGALIVLFKLDATAVNAGFFYFTDGSNGDVKIVFDGCTYLPLPIETEGFEWSSINAPPRPMLRISNVNKFLHSVVLANNDLVGCTLTRIRTFAQFLDGAASADPDAKFTDDVYLIERKVAHNSATIEWELSSLIDNPTLKLPKRQILRDKGFPGAARIRRV